jgi:hypothetical protein
LRVVHYQPIHTNIEYKPCTNKPIDSRYSKDNTLPIGMNIIAL